MEKLSEQDSHNNHDNNLLKNTNDVHENDSRVADINYNDEL